MYSSRFPGEIQVRHEYGKGLLRGLKCFRYPTQESNCHFKMLQKNKPEAGVSSGVCRIYRPEKMKCWTLRSLGGLPGPQEPQGLSFLMQRPCMLNLLWPHIPLAGQAHLIANASLVVSQSLQRPCLSMFDRGAVAHRGMFVRVVLQPSWPHT